MPIRINLKEVFPSDSQDITVDKVNFNFNKLLALGVGDQGDQGIAGPQGAAGPIGLTGIQGLRGSTWFIDSGDPNTLTFVDLIDQDLYLDTITFSVWQYDELTTLWTQVLNFSTIVNYYISLTPSPFNRGFGILPTQDDRFITFNRRGNNYSNSTGDITRGSFNTADSDILLLTNFNESTIDTALGFTNFPASSGEMFDALLKVYVNHSEGTSEVTGRYHLELGSLYLDNSIPAESTLSLLKHNLKVKFKKNEVTTTAIPTTNTWINIAQFSLSVPEPDPLSGIDENGIFEFVSPKWNNESSPIQEEVRVWFGAAEGLSEYLGLPYTEMGDGIAIGDSTGTSFASIGIMKGLNANFQTPYTNDDFLLINSSGLDGVFINDKLVQTNGTLDIIHTTGARFLSKITAGTNDGNVNKDLCSIFSNANLLICTWAGTLAATATNQTVATSGRIKIHRLDSNLSVLKDSTQSSTVALPPPPPYLYSTDAHGHTVKPFPTTNLTHVDVVGKYLFATRIRPQNPASMPVGTDFLRDTLVIAELDSLGGSLGIYQIGGWGDTGDVDEYYAKKVQVVGNIAYVLTSKAITTDWTSNDSYLHAVDITDPTNPVTLSRVTTMPDHKYLDFTIVNERAFISAWDQSAQTIDIITVDIHDPSNLTTPASYTSTGITATVETPAPIKVDGYTLYLGADNYLKIYRIDYTQSKSLSSIVSTTSVFNPITYRISDILINGDYAYIAGEYLDTNRLLTFDVTDLAAPVFVGEETSNTGASGKMTLVGNKLYLASSQGTGAYSAVDGGLSEYEIDGITSPSANISTLKSNEIKVSNSLYVGKKLDVGNSINVGSGGLYVDAGVGLAVDGPAKILGKLEANGEVDFTSFSRVSVDASTTPQTITSNISVFTNTSEVVDFNTTNYDNLSEFNLTTNRFTATYDGYYQFDFYGVIRNPPAALDPHTFALGQSNLVDSNSNFYYLNHWTSGALVDSLGDELVKLGFSYFVGGTRTIFLTAGDWVKVQVGNYSQDFSATVVDLELYRVELTINKIG
jgi:hypothetical protein